MFSLLRFVALAALAGGAAQAATLTPHTAYYEFSLESVRGQTDVVDVGGAMAFTLSATCSAYEAEQAAQMQFFYDSGSVDTIGWTLALTEAFDRSRYDFEMRRSRNGEETEVVSGEAALAAGGGVVVFTAPDGAEPKPLAADVMFPNEHTLALIDAALAGRKLLSRHLFLGDAVEGAALVSAVIGDRLAALEEGPELARGPAWRMRLAFFDAEAEPDAGPATQQDMVLQDDGILRSLRIDYDDFVVRAVLTRIEPQPRPAC